MNTTASRGDTCLDIHRIFRGDREYPESTFDNSNDSLNYISQLSVTQVEILSVVGRPVYSMKSSCYESKVLGITGGLLGPIQQGDNALLGMAPATQDNLEIRHQQDSICQGGS